MIECEKEMNIKIGLQKCEPIFFSYFSTSTLHKIPICTNQKEKDLD